MARTVRGRKLNVKVLLLPQEATSLRRSWNGEALPFASLRAGSASLYRDDELKSKSNGNNKSKREVLPLRQAQGQDHKLKKGEIQSP